MYFLEQTAIENFIEIVDVPKSFNEEYVKTVEPIATTVGVKVTV